MVGIKRIVIKGSNPSRQAEYDKLNERVSAMYPVIHEIYRDVWPLLEGVDDSPVFEGSHEALLDSRDGIDLVLTTSGEFRITVQEKILTYTDKTTLTFEYMKAPDRKGAWFSCIAQYYCCAYLRNGQIDSWVIVNFPKIRELWYTDESKFRVQEYHPRDKNGNKLPTRSFLYIEFADVPESCIYAKSWGTKPRAATIRPEVTRLPWDVDPVQLPLI